MKQDIRYLQLDLHFQAKQECIAPAGSRLITQEQKVCKKTYSTSLRCPSLGSSTDFRWSFKNSSRNEGNSSFYVIDSGRTCGVCNAKRSSDTALKKEEKKGDIFCSSSVWLTSEHLDMKMNSYMAGLSLLLSPAVSLNTPANILFRLFYFPLSLLLSIPAGD